MKKVLMLLFISMLWLNAANDQVGRDLDYMKDQIDQCLNKDLLKAYAVLGNIARYKIGNDYWWDSIRLFFDYLDEKCPSEAAAISGIIMRYNEKQQGVIGAFLVSHGMISAGELMTNEGIAISKMFTDDNNQNRRRRR